MWSRRHPAALLLAVPLALTLCLSACSDSPRSTAAGRSGVIVAGPVDPSAATIVAGLGSTSRATPSASLVSPTSAMAATTTVAATVAGSVIASPTVGSVTASTSAKPGSALGVTSTTAGGDAPTSPSTSAAGPGPACGRTSTPPGRYEHVVVIMEENRTWSQVGGVGFGSLPYLGALAAQCSVYRNWIETNTRQNSLTQYVGLTSGVDNPATVYDCAVSARCRSTDDNIFRQVRTAGGTARSFVEGATAACSARGNAAKHVPALYYAGGDDPAHCADEVRPLSELDPDHLPTFAFVTPTLCHDGHDCSNTRVDAWLSQHLQPILAGASYQAGTTAVFVLYDEDHPVPNLIIAPTAVAGQLDEPGAGHRAALRTIEALLGLPTLPSVADAPSLRSSAHI